MKTQKNNKLGFTKNAIVELNDTTMYDVKGGSILATIIISALVTSPIVAVTTLDPN